MNMYFYEDGDTVEIDSRVLIKDFDLADLEITAIQKAEAEIGDNDEEMAVKFGY